MKQTLFRAAPSVNGGWSCGDGDREPWPRRWDGPWQVQPSTRLGAGLQEPEVGVEVRIALWGLVPRGDGQTPKWAPQTEVSAGVSQNPQSTASNPLGLPRSPRSVPLVHFPPPWPNTTVRRDDPRTQCAQLRVLPAVSILTSSPQTWPACPSDGMQQALGSGLPELMGGGSERRGSPPQPVKGLL